MTMVADADGTQSPAAKAAAAIRFMPSPPRSIDGICGPRLAIQLSLSRLRHEIFGPPRLVY
jgi:hypothetical protein